MYHIVARPAFAGPSIARTRRAAAGRQPHDVMSTRSGISRWFGSHSSGLLKPPDLHRDPNVDVVGYTTLAVGLTRAMSTFLASPTAKKSAPRSCRRSARACATARRAGPDHPPAGARRQRLARRRAGSVEALAAAHYNDGAALQQRGALREAVRAYEQAVSTAWSRALQPRRRAPGARAAELAAACYARRRAPAGAPPRALQPRPRRRRAPRRATETRGASPRAGLSGPLFFARQVPGAIASFRAALRADGTDVDAHISLEHGARGRRPGRGRRRVRGRVEGRSRLRHAWYDAASSRARARAYPPSESRARPFGEPQSTPPSARARARALTPAQRARTRAGRRDDRVLPRGAPARAAYVARPTSGSRTRTRRSCARRSASTSARSSSSPASTRRATPPGVRRIIARRRRRSVARWP